MKSKDRKFFLFEEDISLRRYTIPYICTVLPEILNLKHNSIYISFTVVHMLSWFWSVLSQLYSDYCHNQEHADCQKFRVVIYPSTLIYHFSCTRLGHWPVAVVEGLDSFGCIVTALNWFSLNPPQRHLNGLLVNKQRLLNSLL